MIQEGDAFRVPANYFDYWYDSFNQDYLNGTTSHEIGHCLGLFHTFHSHVNGPLPELADFTECNIRGDYLCDTPADHSSLLFHVDSNCVFNQPIDSLRDAIGSPVSPDPLNIMAYTRSTCRHYFSPLQVKAMHCAIRNDTTIFPTQRSVELKIEDITIDSVATWTGNRDIQGNIFVNANGDLTIEDTIKMPFFASIIIAPGGKLTINGAYITSFTIGQFWQGIIVEGTGQATGSGLLLLNGATLEHARLAVFAENGGRINAENSIFKNNKKSIYISQKRTAAPIKIIDCNFITDEELFDVAWHVPLWDSTILELNGDQNIHPDHDFFIKAQSSNLISVTGSSFVSTAAQDENRYGTGIMLIDTDMVIMDCHFENQRFGVAKKNSWPGGLGVTSIKNNTFEDCRWSILLDVGDFTRIVGNTFKLPNDTDSLQIAAGIVDYSSIAVQIKDGNSFAASDANNSFFIYSDKFVDKHASEITRNTFGRADSSSWRQVELHGAQENLQIFCNNFSLSGGSDFAVGLEAGTTMMTQGTPERPAGNDWSTLGNCPSVSNDESHIYSDGDNDAFQYFGFSDRVPDCVSHNVNAFGISEPQQITFCDIPTPCPPPSIPCGTEVLDSTLLVIDTLLYRPPFGMSQADIDRNLGFARHTKNIIVQDILIDLLEQDSMELALEWLDSVVVRMDEFDSLHLMMLDRYDDLLQRPLPATQVTVTSSLILKEAILTKLDVTRKLLPLNRTHDSPQSPQKLKIESVKEPFKIWPNPASNEIKIQFLKSIDNTTGMIQVSDLNGKMMLSESNLKQEIYNFSVQNWPPGIYLIRIFDGGQLTGIEKLIIIH